MEDPPAEIPSIIHRLTQSPPSLQRQTIESYFTPDASFTHPFCRTGSFDGSRWLIWCIYRWYKILSPRIELEVESVGSTPRFPIPHLTHEPALTPPTNPSLRPPKPDPLRHSRTSLRHLLRALLPRARPPHHRPPPRPSAAPVPANPRRKREAEILHPPPERPLSGRPVRKVPESSGRGGFGAAGGTAASDGGVRGRSDAGGAGCVGGEEGVEDGTGWGSDAGGRGWFGGGEGAGDWAVVGGVVGGCEGVGGL